MNDWEHRSHVNKILVLNDSMKIVTTTFNNKMGLRTGKFIEIYKDIGACFL